MARARTLAPHRSGVIVLCMSILVVGCWAVPEGAPRGVSRGADDSDLLQIFAAPNQGPFSLATMNASAVVNIEKDRSHTRYHAGSIGMPSLPWLPVAMEFELWADAETTGKVKEDLNSAALLQTAVVVKYALDHAHARPSAVNDSLWAHMRSLHIKEGHDAKDLLNHWNWERENSRGMLELATPVNLTEEQVLFAMKVVDHASFTKMFHPGDSFQIHVDAQCLMKDDRRLIGLLLTWEHFHDAILNITDTRRKGIEAYASKIADKSPDLLSLLQQRWLNEKTDEQETLDDAFARLEPTLVMGRARKLALAPPRARDGYRDLAVNVCHLLNVNCCQDCTKNQVPKFGALEFRVFDAAFAPSVLLAALAERLVQQSCAAPLADMAHLLALPGVEPAQDAKKLLEFLQLDALEFATAFPTGRDEEREPVVDMLKAYQRQHHHHKQSYHRGSIGLPDKDWLLVSVELELWGDDELTAKVKKLNNTALVQSATVVQDVLANRPKEESNALVHAEATSWREGVRRLHVKEGHDSLDDLSSWNWERENSRGMLELASPCNLTESEARFSVSVFDDARFRKHFYPGDSFHVHVDSRCLLEDKAVGDKRVIGLLLMWEHFYDAILDLTNSRRKGIPSYASKIGEKSPELLAMLQERWAAKETKEETLSEAFVRLESTLRDGRDRDLPLAPKNHRDGYRDFAVNACHLLDMPCCHDCDKNLVPKFGALEFRVFDAAFAESILFIALTQRLVQSTCAASLDEMEHLLELPSATPAEDAGPLLEFLQLDMAEFREAFHHIDGQPDYVAKTEKKRASHAAASHKSVTTSSTSTNSSASSRRRQVTKHDEDNATDATKH